MKVKDIDLEKQSLSEDVVARLYFQTIYALERLSEEDLSLSIETSKEFLRNVERGLNAYRTLVTVVAITKGEEMRKKEKGGKWKTV